VGQTEAISSEELAIQRRPFGVSAGSGVKSTELERTNVGRKEATWLILPVVICLSQRLSHACLSVNEFIVKLRMAH
jgi:hypothetical protein